jgi:hypothetical protein
MRSVLAVAVVVGLLAASSASAERRVFIIPNHGGGHGAERCLAGSQRCGAAAATAYCRSRDFARADSFQKVEKDEITGAVPATAGAACRGRDCDQFVAIVCTR